MHQWEKGEGRGAWKLAGEEGKPSDGWLAGLLIRITQLHLCKHRASSGWVLTAQLQLQSPLDVRQNCGNIQ